MILSKKYDEIMDRIQVTDDMHKRILSNIQTIDFTKKSSAKVIHLSKFKKYLPIAACFAVLMTGVIAIPNIVNTENPDSPDYPTVLTPGDGIVEVASAQELSDTLGFEIKDISGLPFDVKETVYTAYWTDLGEISYHGEVETAIFRKSTGDEDNSGDYNTYNFTQEIQVSSCKVTLKGNESNYTLAIWSNDNFSYSLAFDNGITEGQWIELIGEIIGQ